MHRPLSRNGHLDAFSPKPASPALAPPVKSALATAAVPARTSQDSDMDALDNVSDISDVEFPEQEESSPKMEESEPASVDVMVADTTAAVVPRSYISREDIEEISDEEAEWSDEYEPAGGFQDLVPDDADASCCRPVTEFNFSAVSLEPLKCLAGPQDTPYSSKLKLRTSKSSETEASDSVLTSLMPRLEVEEVDEKWIESLEALTGVLQQELAQADPAAIPSVIKLAFLGLDYQERT